MKHKVCGSSPKQIKSDTVLPTAYDRGDISLTNAVLPGNNNVVKLIARSGVIQPIQSKVDLIFDINLEKDSIDLLRNQLAQNMQ